MNWSCLVAHHDISDQAPAPLCELLNDLPFAFDRSYFDQTCRSYNEHRDSERSCHDRPLDRFDAADVTCAITRRTQRARATKTSARVNSPSPRAP